MRVFVFVASLLAAVATAQSTHEQLQKELGRDPVALLRAIGSAKDSEAAEAMAQALKAQLSNPARVHLLRFGLGHTDERVVFGATALLDQDPLPLPELRNAARIVIPRYGDPDVPLHASHVVLYLFSSADVPAILARVPHLDEEDACYWLGALHRLMRPEHLPLLNDLARASQGKVAVSAYENARLGSEFSGQHGEQAIATWLHLMGETPDPDAADGLPGTLTAALRYLLEHKEPERTAQTEKERDLNLEPSWPTHLCRRWLRQCRPAAHDLPLLQRLLRGGMYAESRVSLGNAQLQEGVPLLHEHEAARKADAEEALEQRVRALRSKALHASGNGLLTSTQEEQLQAQAEALATELREQPRDPGVLLALARLGDATAAAALRETPHGRMLAFSLLTPAQRRELARECLTLPTEEALAVIAEIRGAHQLDAWNELPGWDDAWFADIEPAAAELPDLAVDLLRALIAGVPSCNTLRLADRLLAFPAEALFRGEAPPRGDLATAGEWPFLEVTRPAEFRTRLRQGLASEDAAVRDTCAGLLLHLGDLASAAPLLAWVQSDPEAWQTRLRWDETGAWLRLARSLDAAGVEWLAAQVVELGEVHCQPLLPALAHCKGMPFEVARRWEIPLELVPFVRDCLRLRDVVEAYLPTLGDAQRWTAAACTWPEPRVQARVRQQLARMPGDLSSALQAQWMVGVLQGDAAALRAVRELCADGRYVMHHCDLFPELLTLGRDLRTLPFWIEETGANCCRNSDAAMEAFENLFAGRNTFDRNAPEGIPERLRRRLLPLKDRLRWSVLANGYVVAGN